jgi:WhiB family transcriptional regulator, redox-sensing transcriptional regulator
VSKRWQHDAACQQADPELFFPVGDPSLTAEAQRRVDAAKRWCMTCDVVAECKAYALATATSQDYGIWGGLTQQERQRIRRRRTEAARAAARAAEASVLAGSDV